MHDYYPNPFDFVPFPEEAPVVKTHQEWTSRGVCCTGYFEVRIKALTPVHVVGEQIAEQRTAFDQRSKRKITNYRILQSPFASRNDSALISATTLRGCLRTFLETATNGWVSEATPYYERKYKERHLGFTVLDGLPDVDAADRKKIASRLRNALPDTVYPDPKHTDRLDLISYLFGTVQPKGPKDDHAPAWKGRVIIEDAPIGDDSLGKQDADGQYFSLPDIEDTAFMGGAKPSASNWWYMFPAGIQRRGSVCEFIGDRFRGRKFYYHQSPQRCVNEYLKKGSRWPTRFNHPLYPIPLECLKPRECTHTFRIYVDNLPEPYLDLLLFALFPGPNIRHKLGYGKPYGFGSFKFEYIRGTGKFRKDRRRGVTAYTPESFDSRYERLQEAFSSPDTLFDSILHGLVHRESLEQLGRVLGYQADLPHTFMYPAFKKGDFQFRAKPREVDDFLRKFLGDQRYNVYRNKQFMTLPSHEARNLAEQLLKKNYKAAIDFDVYQKHAKGFADIAKRTAL